MKGANRKFTSLIFLFIFIFLIPASHYGQSYQRFSVELRQIVERAKWQIGPFRIYPTIQLRDIGYDDNVYRKREEDNPISDYTATVSPQFRVYLLFRNWLIFSFSENPEYVYFIKEKRERSFNNSYSTALKALMFNRFVLSGNYRYQKSRRRATSEFDVRADEEVKQFNGSFFYETARGTSFGISGSVSKISYEDVALLGEEIRLSRLLNREEIFGQFEFYYRIFSESYFFLAGGYTEYNFEHIESQSRNSFSYQLYSGIQFPLLGRIRGTFSLGYKRLLPVRKGKNGFSGLVGDISVNFRIMRFGFRIQYSRNCYFSYYTNNIFFLEDRYGLGISFYPTQFLRFDYDFVYGKNIYPESMMIRLPEGQYEEIKRDDTQYLQTAGVVFRIIRSTGIGVRFSYWKRESNVLYLDRDRWFIGGFVTYEF